MSKHFKLDSLDEIFSKVINPIIINDLDSVTEEDKRSVNSIIMTTYEHEDVLSAVPSCSCRYVSKGYNLGRICPKCNTPVVRPAEGSIDLNVWLRVPDGVTAFMSPVVWIQINRVLSPSGFSLLEWLTNPNARSTARKSQNTIKRMRKFEELEWVRGINYLVANFDRFLDLLLEFRIPKAPALVSVLRGKEDCIFSQYLPMPTKSLLVLERTYVGNYADVSIAGAVDAARTIMSLRTDSRNDIKYLESKTVSIIKNLSQYYTKTIKDSFCGKKGWLRGQLFSSRSQFCFRGVITSISGPHHYEDLHIPWAQGLELFKYHLISKLLHRNFNSRDAFELVESSGNVYVPILDELFQEIINDVPNNNAYSVNLGSNAYGLRPKGRGIPNLFLRNPALERGSSQLLNILKVKSDVTDKTVSLSPLALFGPNAD